MERAALPAITGGDKLFATVTFKAIATGSAAIGFTSSSYVTSGDSGGSVSDLPLQTSGVVYNITSSSTKPTSSSTGSSSSPHVTKPTSSSTGSSSETSTPADSSTNNEEVVSTPKTKKNKKAVSSQAEENTLTDNKGTLEVLVVDQKQQPVEGAKVTTHGKTSTTGKNGTATFNDLPTGKNDLVVDYKGNKTFGSAEVKSTSTVLNPDSVTIKIKRNNLNPLYWLFIPALIILIGTGAVYRNIWLDKIKNLFNKDETEITPAVSAAASTPTIKSFNATPPGSTITPSSTKPISTEPVETQGQVKEDTPSGN
jgi:Na+-translocating ferredoxin:NAD+ oxidoreductase RnfG subunit